MINLQLLLAVDDLGQAVPPHSALCLGTGLQDVLLPRLQRPHSQTPTELLRWDAQQLAGSLQEV